MHSITTIASPDTVSIYHAPLTLSTFPEELLERILTLAIRSPPLEFPSSSGHGRPSWHTTSRPPPITSRSSTLPSIPSTFAVNSPQIVTKERPLPVHLSPLLTSRLFSRIATPLLYHTVHLHSPSQAALLLRTLTDSQDLGKYVRTLIVSGVWPELSTLVRLCPHIESLDLGIDDGRSDVNPYHAAWNPQDNGEESQNTLTPFFSSLLTLKHVKHLTLRKDPAVYLSQPKVRNTITGVAQALQEWKELESVYIAFRLSDDSPSSPAPTQMAFLPNPLPTPPAMSPTSTSTLHPNPGPITLLTHALASLPKLHTFTTHLPSIWNTTILTVSQCPTLERICLISSVAGSTTGFRMAGSRYGCGYGYGTGNQYQHQPQAIVGTGLFLMEARKYHRLGELIRAGTPIIRTRAHTMGTVSPAGSMSMSLSSSAHAHAHGSSSEPSKEMPTVPKTEPIIQRPWEM